MRTIFYTLASIILAPIAVFMIVFILMFVSLAFESKQLPATSHHCEASSEECV